MIVVVAMVECGIDYMYCTICYDTMMVVVVLVAMVLVLYTCYIFC